MKIVEQPKEVVLPPLEEIADAILKLSAYGAELQKTRLTEKTVVLLLSHMCKMPQRDVSIVLHNLPLLAKEYLKQPVTK